MGNSSSNASANSAMSQLGKVGVHVRLTRRSEAGDHHITIPLHSPLRVGTLNAILTDLSLHLKMDKEELIRFVS